MRTLINRIKNEPVILWQLIAALVALAATFGHDLTIEQTASLFVVFQAGAALLGRQLVTPTRKIPHGTMLDESGDESKP